MTLLRRALAFLPFLLTLGTGALAASGGEGTNSPVLQLEGGLWFDGETFVEAKWYVVNGRFTANQPERIDATIHLEGRYILPPLADAHNHDAQNFWSASRSIDKNLGAGVFYSGQMCANPAKVAEFKDLLSRPSTLDLLFTGACISSSDGHPLGLVMRDQPDASPEELRSGWTVVDTLADIENVWPGIRESHPELIKLILVNSENFAENRLDPALFGFNGLDPDLIAPLVERAHRDGIRVVVHTDSAADFEVAIAAGANIVGHLPGYRFASTMKPDDYRISDDAILEAARRGTIVMTTAGVARYYLQVRPENAEALRSVQADNLRRLHEAGVTLAIGSDQFAGTAVDEILYLDSLGVIPTERLIGMAVHDTPLVLFPRRKIGGFGEGKEASLVAYDNNPISDLGTLRSPALLLKQGNLLTVEKAE